MRLTRHTDYALRTLIYLSADPGKRVRVGDIADAYQISHHHLTKVVQRLSHNGYVTTLRGQQGGVILTRAPGDIRIGQVLRDLEPMDQLVECIGKEGNCAIRCSCSLPKALRGAMERFMAELDALTLEDICDREAVFQLLCTG